jgi:alkanesulfonate monooxygenase SsuD/methylene tetrahydromethanopterin reductase-like flavin-dependent oxidoreductase (luciferase family)
MENHGTRYETRYQVMRERVLAMKAIWTQEEAAFNGRFVHFDPIWSYPKHPPILLGGGTDHTLKRVIEFGDGWLPIATPGFHTRDAVNRLRRIAAAAGRDPSTLSVTVFGAPADPAALAEYEQAGIQRALLEVPDLSRDEILRVIDKHASLAQRAI